MNKKRTLLFFAVLALFNLTTCLAHPVTPTYIVERGLDSSIFGTALAAQLITNFLFSPFWGVLSNYIPTRKIFFLSCLGYCLAQVFFFLARTDAAVLLARLCAGPFVGGCYTAIANYLVFLAPDEKGRGSWLTISATIASVVGAIGYFVGGLLGEISTETALLAQVILLAVSAVLFRLCAVDDTPFKEAPSASMTFKEVNPFRAFASVRKYMTTALLLLFLVVAISTIGQNSFDQCFNYFIKDRFGMTSSYNGTFKALIALLTLLLNSTVCLILQRKTNIHRTFLYVLAACTLLCGVVLIFTQKWLFIAIYILYTSVMAIRLPLFQTMIADLSSPEGRGSLMGFYQSTTSLGGIFGSMAAGLIYDQNVMFPFVLAFAAYLVATVIGLFYSRVKAKESRA